ncbi:MAG TPA: hypothetical protein VFE23_07285 [Usitatibacter sp.]|jgi:hypothetical protein|nr:hypothetical protein [Usitatibacter sp.]
MAGAALAAGVLGSLVSTGAGAATACVPGPNDRPEVIQGAATAAERNVAGGYQGAWCGSRLVGGNELFDRGSYGNTAIIGKCIYSSMRDPSDLTAATTGTAVVDNSVPSNPQVVGMLRTPAMIRAYSTLYIKQGKLVGAFKDFGPNGTNPLDIYDVSGDCMHPTLLSSIANVGGGNHDGWVTNDAKTYYGIPFGGVRLLSGSGNTLNPARIDMHVTDLSDATNPKTMFTWNRLQLPAEIQALATRPLAATNFHDVSSNRDGTRLYMALYGGNNSLGGNNNNPIPEQNQRCSNGMLILDSSEIQNRVPNGKLKFVSFTSWCDQQIDPDFGDGSTASAHATEYIVHENGKEYVLTTDESGGGLEGSAAGVCAQRTYARMIDITDETHPQVVGTFKPDVNKPENCSSNLANDTDGGMVHYIGMDDRFHARVVFYAAANSGVRVVDWRDPANPKEIAYYHAANDVKTAAGATDFTRPDIQYDPSNCLIYTGWNQGGLKTLELTNPEYNSCMHRAGSGGGFLLDGKGQKKAQVDLLAQRVGSGDMMGKFSLSDRQTGDKLSIDKLTMVGSVRDACGSVPSQSFASMQFEGTGTYNGAPASFRVCLQQNANGAQAATPDLLHVSCTSGCSYSADGAVQGSLKVNQQ